MHTLQVLFVCESIKFGDRNMDNAGGLTFVSALSREEVLERGAREVFLVSASQLGVRSSGWHQCSTIPAGLCYQISEK